MNQNFFTIEEMAGKWNIPARRIQYLCKQGRVEGATKKAGVWFIPEDAQILPSARGGASQEHAFTGTKKELFESAIRLFMLRGYETVSIRDITDAVGIRQSAAYYHFKSKQQILDCIYDYYRHYSLDTRPKMKDLEPVLRQGSTLDIAKSLSYDFDGERILLLQSIMKIIFQRCAIDESARRLAKELLVDEGVKYVEDVIGRAIAIGRIAPMDVHSLAIGVNSIRLFTMLNWIMDDSPENMERTLADEARLFTYVARFLTDLKETKPEAGDNP